MKTRTSLDHGSPHEAITDDKLRGCSGWPVRWAEAHGVTPQEIRIDLVAVLQPGKGRALVEHVRGIG